MNLTQIRYFVAIARNRSFSQAANELRVAQPALTRHLKLLEAELGEPVFVRHQRGVDLTEFGRTFLERAEFQIRSFDQMCADVKERSASPSGLLRIGCPPALAAPVLARPVQVLRTTFPKIQIQVRESFSDQLTRELLVDALDFAVASVSSYPQHVAVEPLFREQIWLFADAGSTLPNRVTPKFLSTLPLFVARRTNIVRELVESYVSAEGHSIEPVVETDSTQLITDLVMNGVGYAIAPRLSYLDHVKGGRMIGKPIPGLHVARCIIQRKDRPATRAANEFLKLLRRHRY